MLPIIAVRHKERKILRKRGLEHFTLLSIDKSTRESVNIAIQSALVSNLL